MSSVNVLGVIKKWLPGAILLFCVRSPAQNPVDQISFRNTSSERSYSLVGSKSDINDLWLYCLILKSKYLIKINNCI